MKALLAATWAAWADIDSLKYEEPRNQSAVGSNPGRVFLFATETPRHRENEIAGRERRDARMGFESVARMPNGRMINVSEK